MLKVVQLPRFLANPNSGSSYIDTEDLLDWLIDGLRLRLAVWLLLHLLPWLLLHLLAWNAHLLHHHALGLVSRGGS